MIPARARRGDDGVRQAAARRVTKRRRAANADLGRALGRRWSLYADVRYVGRRALHRRRLQRQRGALRAAARATALGFDLPKWGLGAQVAWSYGPHFADRANVEVRGRPLRGRIPAYANLDVTALPAHAHRPSASR